MMEQSFLFHRLPPFPSSGCCFVSLSKINKRQFNERPHRACPDGECDCEAKIKLRGECSPSGLPGWRHSFRGSFTIRASRMGSRFTPATSSGPNAFTIGASPMGSIAGDIATDTTNNPLTEPGTPVILLSGYTTPWIKNLPKCQMSHFLCSRYAALVPTSRFRNRTPRRSLRTSIISFPASARPRRDSLFLRHGHRRERRDDFRVSGADCRVRRA